MLTKVGHRPIPIQGHKKDLKEKERELKKACGDFEAIFINEMFKEMRKASFGDALIQKTRGYELWEDMFYRNISEKMAEGGGIGLSNILYNQLKGGLR